MLRSFLGWLDVNKPWVFSGIGVAVVTWVGLLLWYLRSRLRTAPAPPVVVQPVGNAPPLVLLVAAAPQPEPPHRMDVSAQSIFDALRNLPPLQREDVSRRYLGLRVDWRAKLASATSEKDGSVELLLSVPLEPYVAFYVKCWVPLAEYRELGITPEGAPIRVVGKIRQFLSHTAVVLRDVELYFEKAEMPTLGAGKSA